MAPQPTRSMTAGFVAADFLAGLKGERDATGETQAGKEDGEEDQFGFHGRRAVVGEAQSIRHARPNASLMLSRMASAGIKEMEPLSMAEMQR